MLLGALCGAPACVGPVAFLEAGADEMGAEGESGAAESVGSGEGEAGEGSEGGGDRPTGGGEGDGDGDPTTRGGEEETTGDEEETTGGDGDGASTGGDGDGESTGGDGDGESTGGDGDGDGEEPVEPPAMPEFLFDVGPIKQFEFSWMPTQGAQLYRLLERPNLQTLDYAQVGGDILETEVSITVPLYARSEASYILRACNGLGCTDSAPAAVQGTLAEAVGYIKASNPGADDDFGYRVALSTDGRTLAVGALWEDSGAAGIDGNQADNSVVNSGAVYVYTRSAQGWAQQAYIKASNPGVDDQFGQNLSLSGDGNLLAVGAWREDSGSAGIDGPQGDNSVDEAGAVYVFLRDGDSWSQQSYIKASNPGDTDYFGRGIGLSKDGSTLAVGAIGEDSGATGINGDQSDNSVYSGAVYVFDRAGDSWVQQAYIKASNPGVNDFFGGDLALSENGDTLAVGAEGERSAAVGIDGDQNDDSLTQAGAVYLFVREGQDWSQQAYIKASSPGSHDFFGRSVALSSDGDTLAVVGHSEDSSAIGLDGDPFNDDRPDSGAVYVFTRDGDAWSQTSYIKASHPEEGDRLGANGCGISLDGNVLVVGATYEDGGSFGVNDDPLDNSVDRAGAAYVFVREGASWRQEAYLKAPNPDVLDWFGWSVAVSGDGQTIAVGAMNESSAAMGIGGDQANNGASKAGAVYLY